MNKGPFYVSLYIFFFSTALNYIFHQWVSGDSYFIGPNGEIYTGVCVIKPRLCKYFMLGRMKSLFLKKMLSSPSPTEKWALRAARDSGRMWSSNKKKCQAEEMLKNKGKVREGRTFRAQLMFNSNIKSVFQSAGGTNRERKRAAKMKAFSTTLSAKERHIGSVKESPTKARANEWEAQRERHKTRRQHRETKDCKNTEKCAMKCSIYTKDISTHACVCVWVQEWQHMTAVMLQSLAATAMKVGLGCGIVRLERSSRKRMMPGWWQKKGNQD